MKQPQLYVFAGPNGAGKSTLSASMLAPGTPVFDGDKELALLKQQFPDTDSGNLYEAVNGHVFSDWKNKAKKERIDCAFETNFRSADVMNSVKEFKDQGYEIRLIFFGLDNVEASIDRVKLRVLNGGHEVSLDNIKANYESGLKNLESYYQAFDSVHIVKGFPTNEQDNKLSSYLTIERGQIKEQAGLLPDWVNKLIKSIALKQSQKLIEEQNQQQEQKQQLKNGQDQNGGIKR
ncbi:zeta toxin family protein [Mucilaginibacter lappiensis]|uniref:Putative ABC-type ATPase n=1 Tax=Mucilaginibacter lappiensis TaxID=354630 RepID=A0A841JL07_9SPHI|nr:zeta toxin family protein [Mucilaginibacter lappiensis]MBB6129408.1 putative ABC-type ATPase [Mucilaginibacter lappiensis]